LTRTHSKASFFGNAAEQVAAAHAQIASLPELHDGYDAIGLSQGGQLLRSLAQSYPAPRMHTLITLGSPHLGVARLPPCSQGDLLCRASEWALRAGVWTAYAQSHVVPAQYFRCVLPPRRVPI
jgi:palmitoyl-protein thioesterase